MVTITAANRNLGNTTQTFVLTVTQAPTFTSPANATFSVGVPGSFIVETRGNPVASLTKTGALPSGVIFVNNADGTAKIAGTPAVGSAGNHAITITAANGVMPNAAQIFTLTVTGTPTPTPTPTPSATPTPTPVVPLQLNCSTFQTDCLQRQEKMLQSAGSSSRAVI